MTPLRTLVVGLGNMGLAHAGAYHANSGFEIVGLVNRTPVPRPQVLEPYPFFSDFKAALEQQKPELVCIATYTDSHAAYAIAAMELGAHVFVEKPLAASIADAKAVVAAAARTGRKLVVGYILRHHPSWTRFISEARRLGPPFVFRMNLNQQSAGKEWATHRSLLDSTSPIVDCGVHYVDVMCQITDAAPIEVRAIGLRLSDEIAPGMYNYGQLQVLFADGSIGWYEAGWGPMISETAFFVKDVISPRGAVSIVMAETAKSADMETHTRTATIRLHLAELDADGNFAHPDRLISMEGEPGHMDLCAREQAFVLKAIHDDLDLTRHLQDAVSSLTIVLAADESVRTARPVRLDQAQQQQGTK